MLESGILSLPNRDKHRSHRIVQLAEYSTTIQHLSDHQIGRLTGFSRSCWMFRLVDSRQRWITIESAYYQAI